jgi:L-aminopeptidase/D-esterase-like protein
MLNAITDVKGLKVGHATDLENCTGCTVVISERPFVATLLIRGSASGTRQVDALFPGHLVETVNVILLAGGSVFGLDCAAGVMQYLEERGIGFDVGGLRIPIVPTAVIFDLFFKEKAGPSREMGYRACLEAKEEFEEGSVGAGTGATVGKLFEMDRAMKGGLGTSSIVTSDGLAVGALVVVNAFGDVVDNVTGKIIAGLRKSKESLDFENTSEAMGKGVIRRTTFGLLNTTLAVVATNGAFNKQELRRIAMIAQSGLSRTIVPAHTTFDGDVIFALSTAEIRADVNRVGILGDFVIAEAVKRAVKKADGFGILPAYRDIYKGAKVV